HAAHREEAEQPAPFVGHVGTQRDDVLREDGQLRPTPFEELRRVTPDSLRAQGQRRERRRFVHACGADVHTSSIVMLSPARPWSSTRASPVETTTPRARTTTSSPSGTRPSAGRTGLTGTTRSSTTSRWRSSSATAQAGTG